MLSGLIVVGCVRSLGHGVFAAALEPVTLAVVIQVACGQDSEDLRALPGAPWYDELANCSFVDRDFNALAFGLPATDKTQAIRSGPTNWLNRDARCSSPRPAAGPLSCQAGSGPAATNTEVRQLRPPVPRRSGLPVPGSRGVRSVFTLIAERCSLSIIYNLVISQWERTTSTTQWPPRHPSTGCSITSLP